MALSIKKWIANFDSYLSLLFLVLAFFLTMLSKKKPATSNEIIKN